MEQEIVDNKGIVIIEVVSPLIEKKPEYITLVRGSMDCY